MQRKIYLPTQKRIEAFLKECRAEKPKKISPHEVARAAGVPSAVVYHMIGAVEPKRSRRGSIPAGDTLDKILDSIPLVRAAREKKAAGKLKKAKG